MSDNNGIDNLPNPPSLRGVFTQAKCVKCESTDAATTSAPIVRNSSIRSLKAKISVGQTNVLQTNVQNYYLLNSPAHLQSEYLQIQRIEEKH